MDAPLALWTNLWSPWGPLEHEIGGILLSGEQRQRVDAIFREAIGTTEGKLAIALGRAAEQMSTELYAYYEPLAYLVIVLDPFEKNVSVCVNRAYWDALAFQFRDVTGKAEQFLRDDQIIEALGLCIREGRAWVESMMKMGPP